MKHPDIDASLCAGEPLLESLDDGFSPPAQPRPQPVSERAVSEPAEPTLGPKSPF